MQSDLRAIREYIETGGKLPNSYARTLLAEIDSRDAYIELQKDGIDNAHLEEIDRLNGLQRKWAEENYRAERHRAVAEMEANRLETELAESELLSEKRLKAAIAKGEILQTMVGELAEAQDLIDSLEGDPEQVMWKVAACKAERARCIAAIEASCMICPECIVEAVKVIEAPA